MEQRRPDLRRVRQIGHDGSVDKAGLEGLWDRRIQEGLHAGSRRASKVLRKQVWMYLRSICLFAVSLPVLAQTIPSTTSEPATGIPQLETGVPQPAAGIEQPAERIQLKPATGISALLRDDSARLLYERPGEYSMDERVRDYVNSLISPGAFGKTLLGTGWKELNGIPPEWGTGAEGFGRTFAYKYLNRVTSNTIEFGVAALLKQDTRYFPSTEAGFWPRVGHAVKSTFVVPTAGGGSQFAFARFAGAFGAGAISNAWHPPSERGIGDTLRRGGWSIAGDIGGNLLKEFIPDLKRAIAH